MLIISLIGTILVVVGIVLTISKVCEIIHINSFVGWILAIIGMFLLSFCSLIQGKIIFAILCLIFAIGDIYFAVNELNNEKRG